MSSRRDLKKNINSTVGFLLTDCILYKIYVINSDKEAADKLIEKLLDVQNDFVCRISAVEIGRAHV